jgi:McrBC 5-methylcytosine restriction system component
MYAPLFQDVRQREVAAWDWKAKARAFHEVLGKIRMTDELQKALSYARALLLHLGAWSDDERGYAIPDSFFLNLETLFQDAVTQVLHEIVAPIQTSEGHTLRYPLFPELRDRYIADPDFVIGGESNPFLVGDCKYKDLSGFPAHSDVYQVLSHCLALKNSTALLVYPGEQFSFSRLGETTSGITVHWCTVRIAELKTDLTACMKQFEFSKRVPQAYAMN